MSEENLTRELIESLRGIPTKCDFCDLEKTSDDLEPEEGDMWVCRDCLKLWGYQETKK